MGGCLAAALTAVERLVAAAGDRASLLVCQDLPAAVAALVKTAGGDSSSCSSAGKGGGGERSGPDVLQQWRQRVAAAQSAAELPSLAELLPRHDRLAGNDCNSSQQHADGGQLRDEAVLLLRIQQLLAFADSPQHTHAMAAAQPLRRVLRPTRLAAAGSAALRCNRSA